GLSCRLAKSPPAQHGARAEGEFGVVTTAAYGRHSIGHWGNADGGHASSPIAAAACRTSDSVIGGRTPRSAPRVTRSTQRPWGSPRDFQLLTDDGPQPSIVATALSPPRASSISSRERDRAMRPKVHQPSKFVKRG